MTPDELQRLLGSNINRFRRLQMLTIERLAEASDVSIGHLNDILSGRKWISSDLLVRIANALGVHVTNFFTPVEETITNPEQLILEIGKELNQKIAKVIDMTTQEFLRKVDR